MDRGVDPHRGIVAVLPGDLFVHVEQVAVLLGNPCLAVPLDGIRKIEVHRQPGGPHTVPLVAHLFRTPGGDIARDQVPERRVEPFEVIVPLIFRDLVRSAFVGLGLRDPDAAVIPEAFAHERELGLVLAGDRDACRVYLREAGVAEERAALVRAPCRGGIAHFRVRREEEDVAVAPGGEYDGVPLVGFEPPVDHVARDDPACLPAGDDEVEHLAPLEEFHRSEPHLAHHCGIRAEEQLLACLPPGVKGP